MSPFARVFQLILMSLLFASIGLTSACGKKGPLYHPDTPETNQQSDKAFVFPPKRDPNQTQTTPEKTHP